MPYALGSSSRTKLATCQPKLIAVTNRAIQITDCDFTVFCGVRSAAAQARNVASGASKTMDSKHLRQPDGTSHAVDLVAYVNGREDHSTWAYYYQIAAAMRQAAHELGVDLRWGGVWDRRLGQLPADAAGIQREVAAYGARRRAKGLKVFIDGPHFEL